MGRLVSVVLLLLAVAAVAATPQILPVRPSWKDLETWSRYDESARETEVGLGLHPTGPTGTIALAFSARFPGRTPVPPAKEVTVIVSMGYLANPNVLRTAGLTFLLEEGTPPAFTSIDLSNRFMGDELVPTRNLTSGMAKLTAAEFLRVTRARALKANVMGTEAAFSRAQIDAIRAYGKRVVPAPAR